MFRLLGKLIVAVVVLIVVAGVAAYALGYWQGGGRAINVPSPDVARGRETAREVGATVAEKTRDLSVKARDIAEDGALTAKIKSKMALDDHVKALNIDVDTVDGVVRLTGTVNSQQERDKALQLARDTAGVKEVKDALTVKQ